jgi:DNA-binding LytR/AlgR family response regulator
VLVAGNADAAFGLAAGGANVGVIVVDVDEFGAALVRDLRVVFPNVKIVAVSSSRALRQAAKRSGANATLAWPTSRQRLTKVVTKLLRASR